MRKKLTLFLFTVCCVMGCIASYAQNITFTGEDYVEGASHYLQNVETGYLLKKPNLVVSFTEKPNTYEMTASGTLISIPDLTWKLDDNGVYSFDVEGTQHNWRKYHKDVPFYYLFQKNGGDYYYLSPSANNHITLEMESTAPKDIKNTKYQWNVISEKQFSTFNPDNIKSKIEAEPSLKDHIDNVTVQWISDISTVKGEDDEWYAYYEGRDICLNLQISGFKKGKYAVNFYGMAEKLPTLEVRCLKDDGEVTKNTKSLTIDWANYIVPIEVPVDDAVIDIRVNCGMNNGTNVTGIFKGITFVAELSDESDYFNALQTTWTPEDKANGDFYFYNPASMSHLAFSNANTASSSKSITSANYFNINGDNGDKITFKNGSNTYYVADPNWGAATNNTWTFKKENKYGENNYTIRNSATNNYLKCGGDGEITYSASEDVNCAWELISKEQYEAAYPADRIKGWLNKSTITVTRDFSNPFSTEKKTVWVVNQAAEGINNKYTISGMENGDYVVEVYASKGVGNVNEAKVYVNDNSQVLTDVLQTYIFKVKVTDGTLVIYENAPVGAGTMSLAIKNIAKETTYNSGFVSIFKGESLKDRTAYYINNIKGNSYLTAYNEKTDDIFSAKLFAFTNVGTNKYRIADGQNIIGYSGNSLTKDLADWSVTKKVEGNESSYLVYKGSNYYWINNNGILNLEKNTKTDYFRFISSDQYDALLPQNAIRSSLRNNYVDVLRIYTNGLSMENVGDSVWLVKQPVSGKGNYHKIIINNLSDDIYTLTMHGKVDGGSATIKAQIGDEEYNVGELSTTTKRITKQLTVKGGSLILYVYAGTGVTDVYSSIKSLVRYSDLEGNNSNVNWTSESAGKGNFRLYHWATGTFLHTPGRVGSKLNSSNSTLFTFENGSSSTISFKENNITKYVNNNEGDGDWGTESAVWTISSTWNSSAGKNMYNIYLYDNGGSKDRYIQYNKTNGLQYPREGGWFVSQSDTWSNSAYDRMWVFVSEAQYDSIAPSSIAKRFHYLGTGVTAKWETTVNTKKVDGVWRPVSNATQAGEYNKLTFSGLKDGYYDVLLQATIEGNYTSSAKVKAVGRSTAARTVLPQTNYTYSLPVWISGGKLTISVETTGSAGEVCTIIKDIIPLSPDKGVMDSYLKNPYFALPQGQREWDDGWTKNDFDPSVNTEETGFDGYGIHAELIGRNNQHQKTYTISQKVKLTPNRTYVLSADAVCIGRLGHLYAKANGAIFADTYCIGSKSRCNLEFTVPAGVTDSVEVGFYSDQEGLYDSDLAKYISPEWKDGNFKFVVAVDNFRLFYCSDWLLNPNFDEGDKYWTSKSSNKELFADNKIKIVSGKQYVADSICQMIQDSTGNAIKLPAGAYRLSAQMMSTFTTTLFARVGDRIQKTIIPAIGVGTGGKALHDRTLTFIVPVASEVTVGICYDAIPYGQQMEADDFSLVRTGEPEGTDISCQIVNNDFSIGKDDDVNKKYGWENDESYGFTEYKTDSTYAAIKNSNLDIKTSQVVSGLPDGWYKIEAYGFDRYTEQSTTVFANGSSVNVKSCTGSDDATALDALINNPYDYLNAVTVHIKDGKIDLGVKRGDKGNSSWTVFNQFKLYYLYEENVFEDVSNFIKNPSFETGNTLDWNLSNCNDVKAVSTTDDGWHKDYYYNASGNGEKKISQVISGLPAGEYAITVQVQSVGSNDVNLFAYTDKESKSVNNGKSTSIKTLKVEIVVEDGQDLTIGVSSKGAFNVDNFAISKASVKVYLYNADAGAFFGHEFTSGYDITDKKLANPVGLNSDEGILIKMSIDDDIVTFKNAETDKYINAYETRSKSDEYKYMTYGNESAHSKFKMTNVENSNLCYLSIDPTNAKFGENAKIENAGAANAYFGYYGTTYMGWSGEPGFDLVLPVIPYADKTDKGIRWQVLTEKQYAQYKDIVKDAHSARMAAWPVLCSARRSALQVDYAQFESVYYNMASTAKEISDQADTIKARLLSPATATQATTNDYVDLTFKMADADCRDISTWNNEGGQFKRSETSVYTADKIFSGRHFEAFDVGGLNPVEFSKSIVGLPTGRYKISFTVVAYTNDTEENGAPTGVNNVYAKIKYKFGEDSVKLDAKTFKMYDVTTPMFYVDANNPTPTIGISLLKNNNAKYVALDNIRILYLGGINSNLYSYNYDYNDGVLVLTGTWTNDDDAKAHRDFMFKSLKNDVCTIDFQNNKFKSSDIDFNIDGDDFKNKNLLVYVKSSGQNYVKVSNVTNVVKGSNGGTCSNYVLTDGSPIRVTKNFTATKASYSRTVKSNNGTLCLPFQFGSSDGTQLYTFEGFDDEGRIARKAITGKVDACTPCIFRKAEGATGVKFSASNVTVSKDAPKTVESTDGYELRGVFVDKVFTESTSPKVNECLYIAQDKFWRGKGSLEMDAFRAYIYDGGKFSNVRSFAMFDYSDAEPESTSVENVDTDTDSEIVGYYNLNGQQIDKPASGVVIVKYSDGKYRKVMVR